MNRLLLSIYLASSVLITYAQVPKQATILSKPPTNQTAVIALIRGTYEIMGGIESSDSYAGGLQSRRMLIEIGFDNNTKSNTCLMGEQVFKQENNPNYIRNGVNLSTNYSWYGVEGSMSTGTYKINALDSSITFIWKKKYQSIVPRAKLKYNELDLVLVIPNGRLFTKQLDYDNGEFIRSKTRLAQIKLDEKREEEEKLKQKTIRENENKLRAQKIEEQKKIEQENERKVLAEKTKLLEEKKKLQKEKEVLQNVLTMTRTIGKFEVSGEFEGTVEEAKKFLENKMSEGWRFAFENEIKKLTDFSGMKGNFGNTRYLDLMKGTYVVKNENNEYTELFTTLGSFGKKINFKQIDPQKVYFTFFIKPL